jgi:sarcosine oxidase delta subunit
MSEATQYPRKKETVRPYRLWDAKTKKLMPWRNYMILRHAHMGALVESRWSEVGKCIEVFDIRNGKLKGQYTRTLSSVDFMEA